MTTMSMPRAATTTTRTRPSDHYYELWAWEDADWTFVCATSSSRYANAIASAYLRLTPAFGWSNHLEIWYVGPPWPDATGDLAGSPVSPSLIDVRTRDERTRPHAARLSPGPYREPDRPVGAPLPRVEPRKASDAGVPAGVGG